MNTRAESKPSLTLCFSHFFPTHYSTFCFFTRGLTLQEGGCRGYGLRHAVLAVDGLQELGHAVVLIHNNHAHLQEPQGWRERERAGEHRASGGREGPGDGFNQGQVQTPLSETDGVAVHRPRPAGRTNTQKRRRKHLRHYVQKNNGLFSEQRKYTFFVFF